MAVQSLTKKGKKKWYTISSTSHFKEKSLGETPAYEPERLIGRIVSTSMSNLTGNIRMQNVKISFKIKEVKDNNALTELVGYEVSSAHIKRIVRPGRDRVDASFIKKTKDGVKVVVKPLLLTRFNTHNSVRSELKKKCEEFFDKLFSETDYNLFISELISNRIHGSMKEFLNKTYPLGGVEIRVMKKIEK
ncbi:hypothetical protein J4413_04045 [Candidatus Woesearchaeota archaeon]|nr:hypothetical protein [Candidatus Woesearchaeota archaeon]